MTSVSQNTLNEGSWKVNMLIGVVTPRAVCRSAHSQGASPLP